jgi:hypothetical protein
MRYKKAQWNHRIKAELAERMRKVQQLKSDASGNEYSLRDVTEEAFDLYCNYHGVKAKDAA